MSAKNELPPAIMLMGPTASGKTALSLLLANEFPVEIISVDSALVYREMNIGTSKPSDEILREYPHHLINICSPDNVYSAAEFRHDALKLMLEITERGKTPLLVGGTMLYFKALIQGLSELPSANRDVRERLEKFVTNHGLKALHERLENVDPIAAKKIHPNDPQRIQRALEVFEVSAKPISQWWSEQKSQDLPYSVLKIAIYTRERRTLHQRIEVRFEQMIAQGFVEEVKALRARGDLDLDKPSMRAVGYRQVWQHLDGEFPLEEAVFRGVVATRQLAKRQLTWLRSESDLNNFYSDDKNFEQHVLKLVNQPPVNLMCKK